MSGRLKRIAALTHARNIEFVRDRSSLGWNILLPVLLVAGLGFVFSGDGRPLFKVAVHGAPSSELAVLDLKYANFVEVGDLDDAVRRVERHQFDLLVDVPGQTYWVNDSSPKGYVLDRIASDPAHGLRRQAVSGAQVRYVDWLVPGILGMNMMFSCLFGVGYVIVRYRKSGYLKRLQATPTTAFEFLAAQIASRMILIMGVTVFVYIGTDWLLDFRMEGSYLTLVLIAVLGAVALVAMGMAVAARVQSEELAGGLLNLVTWPMMVISGVWFSIEGSPAAIQWLAQARPLTHVLTAARAVMLDGAGLAQVLPELAILGGMAFGFLLLGAVLFRWGRD